MRCRYCSTHDSQLSLIISCTANALSIPKARTAEVDQSHCTTFLDLPSHGECAVDTETTDSGSGSITLSPRPDKALLAALAQLLYNPSLLPGWTLDSTLTDNTFSRSSPNLPNATSPNYLYHPTKTNPYNENEHHQVQPQARGQGSRVAPHR